MSGLNLKGATVGDEKIRYPNLTDRDREVARLAMRATMDLFPDVAPNIDGEMSNDRYTTKPTLDWCMKVLGVDAFDLDVAACVESHKAARWYGHHGGYGDLEHPHLWHAPGFVDGLTTPWNAHRIWCNPPYDDLLPWVHRAWNVMLDAARFQLSTVIGMLIPDNRREQPFWQHLVEPMRDGRWEPRPGVDRTHRLAIASTNTNAWKATDAGVRLFTHSLPGRQPFGVPGNPEGKGQASPPFGVVLLEWRFA